jgi:hypothetical protein
VAGSAPSKIIYATNSSGAWSKETVSADGYYAKVLLDAQDQPHLLYGYGGNLLHAQKVGGAWKEDSTSVQDPGGPLDAILDSQGHFHTVFRSGLSELSYATNSTGTWASTSIGSLKTDRVSIGFDPHSQPEFAYGLEDQGLGYAQRCP